MNQSATMLSVPCPLCGGNQQRELFELESYRHVRCDACRFVYVNPRPAELQDLNESLYGADHPTWGALSRELEQMGEDQRAAAIVEMARSPARRYRRDLDALERSRENGRLLDIGCSAGWFLLAARERGWQAEGVELSETNAEVGRRWFELSIHTGTLHDAAYPSNTFDVVRANQVIEHLAEPRELIDEAARVLRPGGVFLLSTINFSSWTRSALGTKWRHLGSPRQGHISFFDTRTMSRTLRESGFKIRKVYTMGFRLRAAAPGQRRGKWLKRVENGVGTIASAFRKGGRMKVYAEREPG